VRRPTALGAVVVVELSTYPSCPSTRASAAGTAAAEAAASLKV